MTPTRATRSALPALLCLATTGLLSLGVDSSADAQDLPTTRQSWGAEANGVRAGLCFQVAPASTSQVQVTFVPALLNTSTNNHNLPSPEVFILSLPPFDSRYRMGLTDAVGRPVQKTRKGQALGKPYIIPPLTGVHVGRWPPDCPELFLRLNKPTPIYEVTGGALPTWHWLYLPDYFKIRKSGRYHFTLQMSVLFRNDGSPSHLRLAALPPVEADLDLQLPPKPRSLLGTYASAYAMDILGYTFCLVGVVWLLARRFDSSFKAWVLGFNAGRGSISEDGR